MARKERRERLHEKCPIHVSGGSIHPTRDWECRLCAAEQEWRSGHPLGGSRLSVDPSPPPQRVVDGGEDLLLARLPGGRTPATPTAVFRISPRVAAAGSRGRRESASVPRSAVRVPRVALAARPAPCEPHFRSTTAPQIRFRRGVRFRLSTNHLSSGSKCPWGRFPDTTRGERSQCRLAERSNYPDRRASTIG
jgi:hypothetical protein